jgi:NAD(P)-dependent dehydrogenase (short-subunit alcohol dehydrogenase family)
MSTLSGRVAVVTGASRGIGKGIALALGERGATVYVTGRTLTPGSHALPGTLTETAAEVSARGGRGIAVKVDHGKGEEVAALFERIDREQGRLDILVNNAISLPEDMTESKSFWEKPLSYWQMVDVGLRSYYEAAWHAARLMVQKRCGLMVGISGHAGTSYTYDVVFGMTKCASDRMARDMAIELKPHNVASISLWPGFTYTERAKRNLEKYPAMSSQLISSAAGSVEFPGRIIAALANDPELMKRSGGTFIAAELAQEYGITDIDGRVLPSLRTQRGAPIWAPI